MYRSIAASVCLLFTVAFAWADRAPTDEQRIAPLVAAEGCWGGVIIFVADALKFEVNETVCSDGRIYHLEFDAGLKLIVKQLVR
jgi:NADH:ubiquinone oxidoreductase subunit H